MNSGDFKPKNLNDFLEYRTLCDGILFLDDTIYGGARYDLSIRLDFLRELGIKDITLIINSPGGAAYESLAIYDLLMGARKEGMYITAKVNGLAASAASMIVLQAANKRIATEQSRFLVHEVRSWTFFTEEKTSDKKDELKEMMDLQGVICKILAGRTGKTSENIASWFERKEVWLSAQEAKEFGLIDEVV